MMAILLVLAAHAGMPCTGNPIPESMRLVRTHDPQDATKWYTLAPCLEAMGFPDAAEHAWIAGLAVDQRRVREAEVIDELRRFADASGDDRWLLEAAATARPESDLFPSTRSRLAYAEARRLAEVGDADGALAALQKVDPKQPHGPEARVLAARLAMTKDGAASVQALAAAWAEPPPSPTLLDDLAALTVARGDPSQLGKYAARIGNDSPFYAEALALRAFADPKVTPKALKAAREGWSPDAALLPGAPAEVRAAWVAHRDALAAFVTAWKSKPADAVAAWRGAPYAPVEADLAADLDWSRAAASLDRVATERAAIDPALWGSLAPFLTAELDAAEPYLRERAGLLLIRALDARRAQADEVIRRLDAKEQAPLAWSAYDWGP